MENTMFLKSLSIFLFVSVASTSIYASKNLENNFNEPLFIEKVTSQAEISKAMLSRNRGPDEKVTRARIVTIDNNILQSLKNYLSDLHSIDSTNESLAVNHYFDPAKGNVTDIFVKTPELYPVPIKLNFFNNDDNDKLLYLLSLIVSEKKGELSYEAMLLSMRLEIKYEESLIGQNIFIELNDTITIGAPTSKGSIDLWPVSSYPELYLIEDVSITTVGSSAPIIVRK
jgi:hypothetical protein